MNSCNYLLNYAQTHQFLEGCGHNEYVLLPARGLTLQFLFSFPRAGPGGLLLEGSCDEEGIWEAASVTFSELSVELIGKKVRKNGLHCTQTCFFFLGMGLES